MEADVRFSELEMETETWNWTGMLLKEDNQS